MFNSVIHCGSAEATSHWQDKRGQIPTWTVHYAIMVRRQLKVRICLVFSPSTHHLSLSPCRFHPEIKTSFLFLLLLL